VVVFSGIEAVVVFSTLATKTGTSGTDTTTGAYATTGSCTMTVALV
jgi:hypothetical protein